MSSFTKFYDMPGEVKIENGVVHIDMFDRTPGSDDENDYSFTERIALTMPAFFELYRLSKELVADMEQHGVLRRTAPAGSGQRL